MDQADKLKKILADFLMKWCVSENKRKIYGFEGPQAKASRDDFFTSCTLVLKAAARFTVVKKGTDIELMSQDTTFLGTSLQGPGIIELINSLFTQLKINSLTFGRGVTRNEFEVLLAGLNATIDELEKSDGLSGYLQKQNVTHVQADQMRFKLLKEGEEIGGQGPGGPAGDDGSAGSGGPGGGSGAGAGIGGGTGSGMDASDLERLLDKAKISPESPSGAAQNIPGAMKKDEFSFAWQNFLEGGLGKDTFTSFYGKLVGAGKENPAELARVLKNVLSKQKNIEKFLANIEKKLADLGFSDDQIQNIKESMREVKQVSVSEEELARLRKIEKDFDQSLEQRVEKALGEVKRINQKLSDEKERIAMLLRQSSQGVIVINKQGKVLSLNSFAERTLGVSLKEGQLKSLNEMIKEGRAASLTADWQKETDDFTPKDIAVIASDDKAREAIYESSAVIENEDGQAIGTISSLQNVAEFEELKKRRDEMVEMLGHDLRAPILAARQNLAIVMGIKEFTDSLSPEQKDFLERCRRNIDKMEGLVRTIIDTRQLETGKIFLRKENTDITALIKDCVDSLGSWAADKKIEFLSEIADLPEIEVDPERIYQVVTNLISNALKFTASGGIVTVKAKVSKESSQKAVKVCVIDSGIGIKQEDLAKVFKKYEQIYVKIHRGQGGLGLGLAICKSVVELHGGKIWAESEKDKGSTFIFTIPYSKE